MRKSGARPRRSPCARRIASPSEWKLCTATSLAASPSSSGEPRPQFLGGLAREGDGEAGGGGHAAIEDEVGDAVGQHARLARPGAGDDHHRAVGRFGGQRLVGVERGQHPGPAAKAGTPIAPRTRLVPRFPQPSAGPSGAAPRGPIGASNSRPTPARRTNLAFLEQADDAVFAVVAGLADDRARAQPRHRLGQQRMDPGDVLDRRLAQHGKLGAERGERAVVGRIRHCREAAELPMISARISGRGTRLVHRAGSGGRRGIFLRAVGQHLDAVGHAHGDRPAARPDSGRRAPCVSCGDKPHLAGAVAVEVVLALLGEELDGADIALAGFQRAADGEIVRRAGEARRLAAELRRRVGVGIGDQPEAVERGQAPVHRRVGGQARSRPRRCGRRDRRSTPRWNRNPTASRGRRTTASRCVPARGRNPARTSSTISSRSRESSPRIGRPSEAMLPIRAEPRRQPVDGVEVGGTDQVVDLSGLLALLVDGRDLGGEHEGDRSPARRRQRFATARPRSRARGGRGRCPPAPACP